MNSKNSFITLCKEYEIPIPETYCYYAGEIPIDLQLSYPLYLKYDVSAAGIGVSKCCSPSELNESIYLMSSKIAYQLQEEIAGDKVTVLNVQYFACNNGHAHRVAVTEQVTNNNIHMFNKYPSVYNPFSLFDELANVIAQKGVRDMFTFDVVAVEKGGRVKYIAIECNPRWGTASYPVRIAQKLNIQQWNAVDLETNKKDLSKINLGHLIYSKGSGVVFVNWGCISDRKVGVLIAGDSYDHNEILQELKRRVL
jgi:carbamoylphosphate synthase large subunit